MNTPIDLRESHAVTPASPITVEPFTFTGNGSEYFRIWIVNLLLSIITLGIYSAWAKVRRLKYFYSNTQVAGSNFEYHGNPISILKGRLIAAVLLIPYYITAQLNPLLSLAILAVLMLVMPWFIWKSQQFKLYNSSYRGIRFGFAGSASQAYFTYLLLPIFTLMSLYLLVPLTHHRMKRFQHGESFFGQSQFSFDAKISSFYRVYFIGFLMGLLGALVITVGFAALAGITMGSFSNFDMSKELISLIPAYILSLYGFMFLLFPLVITMIQNLIWNKTKLSTHRFSLNLKWRKVVFITITNLLAIIYTLGLFIPFAQIRMMKYRMEMMSLHVAGNLNEFITDTQRQVSATGEGVADIMDFDFSL